MRRISWSNVLVAIGFLLVGRYMGVAAEPEVITRVDTVPPAAMADSLSALSLEVGGLRAILDGRDYVSPRVILRTDTLVTPPDTVLQLVALKGTTLSLAPLIHTDSLWAPELHRFDVGNCDDGFSWAAGELVCDRARFGHLALYAEAGMASRPFVPMPDLTYRAEAGVEWTPSYRSPWRGSLAMAPDGSVALTVTRGWRLF